MTAAPAWQTDPAMPDTLTVTDNRTGATYEIPVEQGAIRATAFEQMRAAGDDHGLLVYDPAFMNTASCTSRVTYIDGDRGMPTLAALAYRHSLGLPYNYPDNELSFAANFLSMMFKMVEPRYAAAPEIEHALDVLFILHADHEQNCSTSAMRTVGSSHRDPYSATAAAVAALYGPLHGGANEAVVRMIERIGSVDRIPDFVAEVKAGKERLMGFGHRIYKNYDPPRKGHQAHGRPGPRRHRLIAAARRCIRAREDRARG